jgi:hypothetical protein
MNSERTQRASARRLRWSGVLAASAVAGMLVVAGPASATHTTPASKHCTLLFNGPRWTIRGSGSGTTYKVVGSGYSCILARTWARKLAARKGSAGGGGTFPGGPAGWTCHSFSTPVAGDKLIYAGACAHAGGEPFFGWAAKPS